MKLSGAIILILLISVAIVLYLQSTSAKHDLDAVQQVAVDLREAGVQGQSLDRAAAARAIAALDDLVAAPDTIADHEDDLKSIAATAAQWADAAPTPSSDLTVAVAIRTAADELRQYALTSDTFHLTMAKHKLDEARPALTGSVGGTVGGEGATGESVGPSGSAVQGIRDRLQNLQQSERERIQDVQQEINQ